METDLEGLLKLMVAGDKPAEERRLNPTQRQFIYSPVRNKAYMGPAGCAKTTTGVAAIVLRAIMQPGTKYMIARHDYNDLKGTTLERFEEVINRLPPGMVIDRDKSPPAKYVINSIPQKVVKPDGTVTTDDRPSTIQFFGAKAGWGSYDWNAAHIDEADECEEKRIDELQGRLRTPGGGYSVMLTFNPPDKTHWLYTKCTGLDFEGKKIREPSFTLFTPNPNENEHNLPPGYYQEMRASMPEDMAARLIDNQWGQVFPGDPVYRQFSRAMHAVDNFEYVPGATLFRFWDFGYQRPGCLWCMIDNEGRLWVMYELLGKQQEVGAFGRQVNMLTEKWCKGVERIEDYGDPAVKQKKDTGQSLATIKREAGITIRFKHTPFDLSLNEVRKRFEILIEKKPAIQIARRCKMLIGGLAGGYHLKDDGVTPRKDGTYDHLCDCLRYGIWNTLVGRQYNADEVPLSVAYNPDADV